MQFDDGTVVVFGALLELAGVGAGEQCIVLLALAFEDRDPLAQELLGARRRRHAPLFHVRDDTPSLLLITGDRELQMLTADFELMWPPVERL